MTQYSISEARKQLPTIVDDAAAGEEVVLTRHGQEVAALVPMADYRRMKSGRRNFGEAYAEFRKRWADVVWTEADGPEIGPEYWESLRDRSPGREVDFS